MRWCLLIPTILILLTLGMEQCCWRGAAVVKEASQLVGVLNPDDDELKQELAHEPSPSESDPLDMAGWHGVIRLAQHVGLVSPHKGAESCNVHTGIRRHRWLCQERC